MINNEYNQKRVSKIPEIFASTKNIFKQFGLMIELEYRCKALGWPLPESHKHIQAATEPTALRLLHGQQSAIDMLRAGMLDLYEEYGHISYDNLRDMFRDAQIDADLELQQVELMRE